MARNWPIKMYNTKITKPPVIKSVLYTSLIERSINTVES
ncbi:Uncharacterised protein [Vibrio cholerae]|nr:Uncharacterised protein [Vibrio cholerae]CSC82803.1 Uncharacterised protein [Vibrio cholerae]CSI57865.1 Uncharacterised protein [Vibrio cholerae]